MLSFLYIPTVTFVHDNWKNHILDSMDIYWQSNVSAFYMLSRLVIAFLPRSKHLNFTAAITICSEFGAQENKICHCFHVSLSICHEVMGPDAMILVFWMLSLRPAFSLSSFTFIKRLFGSSWLSATRVVSSAHLRLLIFLPAILIPACASSSLAFGMMYSAHGTSLVAQTVKRLSTMQ